MNEINISINWESVKEKIFLRLVNYEKYRADMEGKAYIKFLDLAILFYCDCTEWGYDGFYVSRFSCGTGTLMISIRLHWKIHTARTIHL